MSGHACTGLPGCSGIICFTLQFSVTAQSVRAVCKLLETR